MSVTTMRRAAANVRPPGGRRVGAAELARRLDAVAQLLADGEPRRAIVTNCRRRFGMSAPTVDDYMRRVRDGWAADAAAAAPTQREATIVRLVRLSRALEKKGAWGPLVACERLLADVRGVRAAARVEVSAEISDATPQPRRDLSCLTDDELDALDRISAKLARSAEPGRPSDTASSAARAVGEVNPLGR